MQGLLQKDEKFKKLLNFSNKIIFFTCNIKNIFLHENYLFFLNSLSSIIYQPNNHLSFCKNGVKFLLFNDKNKHILNLKEN